MAAIIGNSVGLAPTYDTGISLAPSSGINVANAQRLGLGGATIAPDPLEAARQSAGLLKPSVPISPTTQKPVSSFSSVTSAPVSAASSGAYKGIPIDTTGDVAAQIAAIDRGIPVNTSTGSTVSADHQGNVTSPSSFSLDTSSSVPSSVLGSTFSTNDVLNTRKTYADYVNGLSQAQQYSPEYLQAYNTSKDISAKSATLQGNLATGNVPGDTQGFAEGFTNRALMGASSQKALADISLATQELMRQGNIAGAKALVDAYAPQSVAPGSSLVSPITGETTYSGLGGYQAVQGIQTVNNLAQTYPDAGISPNDTLETATAKAQGSPSFQAHQTYIQQLAGGQTVAYNKLTGQYETVQGAGDAATNSAAAKTIQDLTLQKVNVQAAITTADANFPLLINAAKQANVNNSAPLINQLQQKFGKNFSTSPAYASLQTLIPSLQTEYARILSRGGAVTDSERANSAALISGTYSVAQLQAVYNTVKAESSNVIAGYDSQIKAAQGTLGGGSSGGLYDF